MLISVQWAEVGESDGGAREAGRGEEGEQGIGKNLAARCYRAMQDRGRGGENGRKISRR